MDLVLDIFAGCWELIKITVLIVFPLMFCLEIAKEKNILDLVTGWLEPVFKPLGFERPVIMPLLVGLVFGLAYGGGVIMQSAREGKISTRQLFLLCAFLAMCHAVIEDTMLYVMLGANGWWIVGTRFVIGVILTFVLAKFYCYATDDMRPVQNIQRDC